MKKKTGFIGEFKEFISRGSVIDLAVGVVIGGAFTAIINSFVKDILMPVISWIIGGISFADLKYVITPATATAEEVAIMYGNLIQSLINFFLIALVIFVMIKLINRLHSKPEEAPVEVIPTEDVLLLREIRDLLEKNK